MAEIRQVMNLPGENIRVLVEGKTRGIIEETLEEEPCLSAVIRVCEDRVPRSAEAKALLRTAQEYLRFNVSTKHVLGLLAVDAANGE